ncbi:MAG: ABC transporter ATP-binding protein [Clostridia bacterium]|nr:ABC transporter ATP-binding protein [Clostridia bacterium]MBR2175772.1 ABC transporter ATP-binding protein [Clostridia bacterium]
MKNRLKQKFALSGQGAKDMILGIAAVVAQNLALMFPVTLLYLFTGDYIDGVDLSSRTGFYIGGIAICLVLLVLTSIWQYNLAYKATYKESAERRISLAEKLRKLPLSFFAKRDLADLTATIMSDVEVMEHAGSHMIPQYYGSIISTLIICIGLFFFHWQMAIAAVWPIPIALVIVLTSKKVQNHFSRKQAEAKIDLNDGVQEFIETSRDLKSNNAEEEYLTGLETKIDLVEKTALGSELGIAVFVVSAQMLLKFGIGTVALVGSMLLINGGLTLMQFFCFLLVASRLYEPMSGTLINLAAVNALQINVDRMNQINNTKAQDGSTSFEPNGYDITFDHAGFSYEDEKSVLSDVSFTAKQGEVTALVGPSGGGKTTVSRLAARFWDTDKGKVTVGGVDVKTVDPETLLSAFSIVFQDVTLFNNTVMENIRVGKKDATDEEVLAAAKLANCDDFIQELPDGYDTVIGENGSELSGGERQRISIARAFLKDAPIILLDEATASLDVENETKVQSALSRLIKNKTVMVIAHRMRTVAGANKIVVLSDGGVAEQGSPAELMEKNGVFAQMVKLQTEGQNWSIA